MTRWFPYQRFCAALTLAGLALLAVACNGGGEDIQPAQTPTVEHPAPTPTATAEAQSSEVPPLDPAVFPVVLEHETLIVASADGSEITETPLEPQTPGGPVSYVSPDGRRTATRRDGTIFMQVGDGDPSPIAEIPSTSGYLRLIWSPDSTRLLTGGGSLSVYVVNADGSGLTDVGAGLDRPAFPATWSPDSEWVALGVYPQDIPFPCPATLYVVRADGTERHLVGEYCASAGEGGFDQPSWSPDGSRIAASSPPSEGGVPVFDASGGPSVNVSVGAADAYRFSWSPDGRFLAFQSRFSEGTNIVVADMTGPGEPRVLTEGRWPRWSPYGDRIAFKRGQQVYTIRLDGSGLVALGDVGPEWRGELTWSPDGQELEFVRAASNVHYLYEVNLRSGDVTRSPQSLGEEPTFSAYEFHLSPQGDQVVFPRRGGKDGEGDAGWFIMDIASGELTQLTDDSRGDDVHWSPEGVRIVFSSGPGGVYVAEGDRSPPRRISELDAYPLAWSPDGKYVAFGAGGDIHVLDVDGTDDRVVAALTPPFEPVQRIEWSPDGNQLLYEAETHLQMGTDTTETFVASLDGAPPVALTSSQGSITGARWSMLMAPMSAVWRA